MKKTNLLNVSLFLLLAVCSIAPAFSQNGCSYDIVDGRWETPDGDLCSNSIITSVPFLRIVPDARSGAMGDAGLAISSDANAMHFNASKLAFTEERTGVSVTYTPWLRAIGLQDVYMAYLSAYRQIDKLQTIGLGLRYFSVGEINFTNDNGEPLATGRPNEFEVNVAYARQLADKFSASVGAKFIYSNLAAGQEVNGVQITPGIAGAADISFTYRTPVTISGSESNLSLGLALTNLGTKISYTNSINRDFIPANMGLGAAWEFNLDEYNSLTIAADFNKLMVPTPCLGEDCDEDPDNDIPDYKEQSMFAGLLSSFNDAPDGFGEELREITYSIGVEYWYDKQFALRAGYYTEDATKGDRRFFTVGLGVKYNVFGLNFSYLIPPASGDAISRTPLDNTLRFSLLFDFAAFDDNDA